MAEAKISISLATGTFEFEGSESFVSAQVERFVDVIQASLKAPRQQASAESGRAATATSDSGVVQQTSPTGFDHVFAATDTGVQILKDVPGSSTAKKTVNAAMLLLFGLSTLKQKDTVLFEEVAAVCKAHGFHDAANMATNLKDAKELFILGGSGKKQTLKLTVPGSKAAAKLAQELQSSREE